MRAFWMLFVLSPMIAGCPASTDCADAGCDTDTDTDGTPADTDSDTDLPEARTAAIAIEWDVDVLPVDNVVTLTCGGRVIFVDDTFTFFTTVRQDAEIGVGEVCTVDFTDARGGRLLGGRAINCSKEVAAWEPARGSSARVAEFTVYACEPGCVDPKAENYDATANLDDGTCDYIYGCNDERALNFDPLATKNDGSCDFGGFAPIDLTVFFDDRPSDTEVRVVCDGSSALTVGVGVTYAAWSSVNARTVIDAGHTCDVKVTDKSGDLGASGEIRMCGRSVAAWPATDRQTAPYEVTVATFFSESCSGCTDPVATNFDLDAAIDDGTCQY